MVSKPVSHNNYYKVVGSILTSCSLRLSVKSELCSVFWSNSEQAMTGYGSNIYIYIYVYIYSHPQTDCFVLSELFSVARHAGRSKPESKPVQLYDRLRLYISRVYNEIPQFEKQEDCIENRLSPGAFYLRVCTEFKLIFWGTSTWPDGLQASFTNQF